MVGRDGAGGGGVGGGDAGGVGARERIGRSAGAMSAVRTQHTTRAGLRVPDPREPAVQPAGASRTVRVALVEDEALFRSMLEPVLGRQNGLTLVHSLGGFQEAQLVIRPGSTDVAVVDVRLGDGDGIELASLLQRRDPRIGILLLSCQDVLGAFLEAQESATRPWSYLSKRSSFATTTLVQSIIATSRGEQVIDPSVVNRSEPRVRSHVSRLSPAQFRVLALVAQGLTNEVIATETGIAVRSVENHLLAAYRTLGLRRDGRNRRVLATLAFLEQTSRNTGR